MLQNLISKLNDLRPRHLLMLAGAAAVLMFITIYGAMSFLQDEDAEKLEEEYIEKVSVVVAKTNIPARTRIQENMLQLKEIPVDVAPKDAIKNFKDVRDVQVKVPIFSGDILTVQKISSEKFDEGFIATIPLDCRAVSISVTEVTSVAGFVKPGDFVDLLLVEKGKTSVTTNVILQNVQLLSINKDMSGEAASSILDNAADVVETRTTKATANPSIATFALHPEDVLKLVSASKIGEIYMSLRPSRPKNAYVGEMEYTIKTAEQPAPKSETRSRASSRSETQSTVAPEPAPAPVQEPLPAIPNNNPVPVMPTPPISAPVSNSAPKIEIIQGDQITQKGEGVMSATSYLPAIPSGVPAAVPSPPIVSEPPDDIFVSVNEPFK